MVPGAYGAVEEKADGVAGENETVESVLTVVVVASGEGTDGEWLRPAGRSGPVFIVGKAEERSR